MNHPTKTYVWWTGVAVALYNENIIIQLPYQTASLPPSAPPAARAVRTSVAFRRPAIVHVSSPSLSPTQKLGKLAIFLTIPKSKRSLF